jgi:hypothetical protein
MRKLLLFGLLAAGLTPGLRATTLLQLSLTDMIQQSTMIVQGVAQPSYTAFRGSIIYTHYQIQVSQVLKGSAAPTVDVAVIGGMANGHRQSYAGAPTLAAGQQYILFLWTSKTGLTQVIGLSQGLFVVMSGASGQASAVRAASAERMLNSAGQQVSDADFNISLNDLKARIQSTLAGATK